MTIENGVTLTRATYLPRNLTKDWTRVYCARDPDAVGKNGTTAPAGLL